MPSRLFRLVHMQQLAGTDLIVYDYCSYNMLSLQDDCNFF